MSNGTIAIILNNDKLSSKYSSSALSLIEEKVSSLQRKHIEEGFESTIISIDDYLEPYEVSTYCSRYSKSNAFSILSYCSKMR